jgi:hypothetical protein
MAEDIKTPEVRDPVAQDNKLVGDEAVQDAAIEVKPEVNTDPVPAQVAPPREADDDTVNVHETVVHTDEVITDPNDPRAVQIPDAGRGSLDLPAHRLAAPTVEAVFAEQAAEVKEVSDADRKEAVRQGVSAGQPEPVVEPEPAAAEPEPEPEPVVEPEPQPEQPQE